MSATAWHPAPLGVLLLVVLAVHERGARRLLCVPDGRTAAQRYSQGALFRLAAILGVALVSSPLARTADDELFARALIDFGLAFVVAPLLVLGAPWSALRLGITRRPRAQDRSTADETGAPDRRPGQQDPSRSVRRTGIPGQPVVGVAALLLSFWLWHIPVLLDATVTQEGVRALEEASVLLSGLLWWSEIVGSYPFVPRLRHIGRSALVTAIFAGYWGLAAAMVYSPTSWYPAFDHGAHPLLSPPLSQEFAGAFMWALPSLPLGVVAFWCFSRWLGGEDADERRVGELFTGSLIEDRVP